MINLEKINQEKCQPKIQKCQTKIQGFIYSVLVRKMYDYYQNMQKISRNFSFLSRWCKRFQCVDMFQSRQDFIRSRALVSAGIRSRALHISMDNFRFEQLLCIAACPTPIALLQITVFSTSNSLPRITVSSFGYRCYPKQGISKRTYCYMEQAIGSNTRIYELSNQNCFMIISKKMSFRGTVNLVKFKQANKSLS